MKNTSLGTIFFLIAFAGGAWGQENPSPISRDSVDADYYRAAALNVNRQFAESHFWALKATKGYFALGDTARACAAMDLQALAQGEDQGRGVEILDSAIGYYRAHVGDTSRIYFRLLLDKGRMLMDMGKFQAATQIKQDLDGMVETVLDSDPARGYETVFRLYTQNAWTMKELGILEVAIADFEYALRFGDRYPGCIPDNMLADCHSGLSHAYRRQENLPQAAVHNRRAVALLEGLPQTRKIAYSLLGYRADYALILADAGALAQASDTMETIIAEGTATGLHGEDDMVLNYASLGHILLQLGQLEAAWKLIAGEKGTFLRSVPENYSYAVKMDINLAGICGRQGRFEDQIQYARLALQRLRDNDNLHGEDCAKAWREAALGYMAIQKEGKASHLDSAEVFLNRAAAATLAKSHLWKGISERTFGRVIARGEYLAVLGSFGKLWELRHLHTGSSADLNQAFRHYTEAAKFLAYMDGTRLNFWAGHYKWERIWKDHYWILEAAIRCGVHLHSLTGEMENLRTAFSIADMGKARQLLKRQSFFGPRLTSLVPEQIHSIEQIILQRIEWSRSRQGPKGMLLWERKLGQLKLLLRRYFPRYYQLKYENQAHHLLTQSLGHRQPEKHTAILQYFVGEDSIYAFLQTSDTIVARIIPGKSEIEREAAAWVAKLEKQAPQHEFAPQAMRLCAQLLPFPKFREGIHRLVIIPDGFLFQLPFAALIRPDMGYVPQHEATTPPYLVHFLALTMDFSLASHSSNPGKEAAVEHIQGFFPQTTWDYFDTVTGQYEPLYPPSPVHALDVFASLAPQEVKAGNAATPSAFLAALQLPGLLEIKTHGLYQEGEGVPDGFLILEDGHGQAAQLFASDLYGVPVLRNRMLVLNACLTARGQYMHGEGPVSLARSFRLAGCPAVLTHQWLAEVSASGRLLADYYEALVAGQSADMALRHAQCRAMEGDAIPRHPYHWAGLSLYGAPDPIRVKGR